MGEKVFLKCPSGFDVGKAFEEICYENGVSPKHLVLDHGTQFYCKETLDWCRKRNIKPRFGAVGKHGSIAVVERLHLSMKNECIRRMIVPVNKDDFEKELALWREWYNACRPHTTLRGRTPDEIYCNLRAANTLPRLETRPKVRHSTPCAKPRMMMAGKAGRHIDIRLSFLEGRSHLPTLTVRRE
jgi:putative transposase